MENPTHQTLDSSEIFPSQPPVSQPRSLSIQDAFDEIFSTLDDLQKSVTIADGHTLCAARPGSGKTRVLVARLLRAMLDHGAHRVTAITFTRASAIEMRSRLSRLVGQAARKVTVCTFHALALEYLRHHSRFKIIDERDRFMVIIRLLRDNQVHFPVDRLVTIIPDYFNHEPSALSTLPEGVVQTLHDYHGYLQMNRMLDLDSLVPLMADLVQSNAIRVNMDCLLVDEFQDVDPAQLRLISAIADQGAHVFCVGDDDQSIYGFRRSLGPEAFHLLQDRLHANILFLSTNYRCAKAVAKAAEYPLLNLSDRIEKPLIISREGGTVRGLHFPGTEEEMMAAANYCAQQATEGRSVAILARTNTILDSMEGILRVADIPYSRSDNKSFWDGPHVRKCLAFLGLPFNPSTHDLYVALHVIPIPFDTIKGVSSFFQENMPPHYSLEQLLDSLYDRSITSSMEVEHAEHFRQWRAMFADWSESCFADNENQWGASTRFFDSVIAHARKQGMISTATILDRVFSSKDKLGQSVPIKTRLQWLSLPQSSGLSDSPSIRISTIHGAKGLEYDVVWILGAQKGVLPHEDAEVEDEERRLFYVGMTRAIDDLTVSNSATAPDTPSLPFSFNWQPPEP